ncbi:thioredoxin family protein [Streptomyces sp. NPDC001262]|uniref:thioredoxin family protein n=1 Tax=unclassified Streptomyces TaxID=2593676 RepID=UPI00368DE8F2
MSRGAEESENMAVTPLTCLDEFENAIAQDKGVVVDFCATWAALCRAIDPVFERFSGLPEFAGRVGFYSVDLDEAFPIAQKAGVGPVPVFMAFCNGVKIGEVVAPDPGALHELIGRACAAGADA